MRQHCIPSLPLPVEVEAVVVEVRIFPFLTADGACSPVNGSITPWMSAICNGGIALLERRNRLSFVISDCVSDVLRPLLLLSVVVVLAAVEEDVIVPRWLEVDVDFACFEELGQCTRSDEIEACFEVVNVLVMSMVCH